MNYIQLIQFPNSVLEPFIITSPDTPNYNCIAWAYGDETRFYWPGPENFCYWPNNISREENINSFIELFESIGYNKCKTGDLEINFNKIALFVDNKGTPTHASRQLDNGFWTSKLGKNIDVQHSIKAIENGPYGFVEVYMKRKKNDK